MYKKKQVNNMSEAEAMFIIEQLEELDFGARDIGYLV